MPHFAAAVHSITPVDPLPVGAHFLAGHGGVDGDDAIAELDLQIHAGAVHSIIGPNGAGKTSLINLLSGVHAPGAGSIKLDGRELTGQVTHRFAAAGLNQTEAREIGGLIKMTGMAREFFGWSF